MIRAFKFALSFLTIVPVRLNGDVDSRTFGISLNFFPVIGLLLGIVLGVVWYGLSFRLDDLAVSAVIVTLLVAMTRMLHIDGLGDTFDGLLGGRDRERALEIMKDSRAGSFGVAAIVCSLIAKVAFLSSVPASNALEAVILLPVLGRWAACYAMVTQPYARTDGLGSLFSDGRKISELLLPTIVTVALALILLHAVGVIAFVVTLVFAIGFLAWVRRKIGGITGDIAGALIELTEVASLFTVALIA